MRSVLCLCLLSTSLMGAEVTSPRHRVIAADKGHIARFSPSGECEWTFKAGPVHGIKLLDNGNLLTQRNWTQLVEVNPAGEVVWEYDSGTANGNSGRKVEVHAFQRLPNGHTMVVENGIGRIIEVDAAGMIQHEVKYQVKSPNAHRDVRQGRKLANGNYLLCHEGEGRVTEYDPQGNIVWDYSVPLFDRQPAGGHGPDAWGNQVFNALRLPSGNTLIATGNGHSVLEVTPGKELVWQLHQQDLPGITLAWTTTLEVLPNGNLVIGNCHAGPKNPQLIEVTRDKVVVWTFRDFDTLGDSTAASATIGGTGVLR
ncbi:MAG: hypothetical protein KDA90_12780 [Planctomycetaceae bacterium]|nr:hypothetical protein [Planctomycetaceae bacterium]